MNTMMQRRSPPKHRHDGSSPLPLGMDWSPPPRKWNGRGTVWPHDPRSGWSYCVIIPSWIVLPNRDSDPVVFYRVQVGLQSPEGVTTTRVVLRRFNHFLKLFTDLKKSFPRKNLPPAPPKGIMRMKSRELLDERRCSLEEWMTKLLSDIDISRSIVVASFLELEAAVRSSFMEENQQSSEANTVDSSPSSFHIPPNSTSLAFGGSSITSDNGSDTAYETSDLGSPRIERDNQFEIGEKDLKLDEDLENPIEKLVKYGMSNIDEGLIMGQTILDQLEGLPRHKSYGRQGSTLTGKDKYIENVSKDPSLSSNGLELFSEPGPGKVFGHARKFSSESVASDGSSLRGSEISNLALPNSSGDGSVDFLGGAEVSSSTGDSHVILPENQRQRINRFMVTTQKRLVSAKTDMEDLIARLNQEMAVKDYLATKVKDLEAELEISKQRSKENLQQANLLQEEREMNIQQKNARKKLLDNCNALCDRLKECTLHLSGEEDDKIINSSSIVDALVSLSTSDEQIEQLLTEARVLFEDDKVADQELREMLGTIFTDNAKLRKRVNSLIRSAIHTRNKYRNNEDTANTVSVENEQQSKTVSLFSKKNN